MTLITGTNFAANLKLSTQGRSGSPDGNFFPNTVTGQLELIGVDELPQIDFGAGLVANPLTNFDGITKQAIYSFERQIREEDTEDLRGSRPFVEGDFVFAGAFKTVFGRIIAPQDIPKIRDSGIVSRVDRDGAINRIYFGVRSLNAMQPTSQGYYQLVPKPVTAEGLQNAVPVDFSRLGDINELVPVFGSTANGDSTAGDFDFTNSELYVKVRTFGRGNQSATSTATGFNELNGFLGGFGVGDTDPSTTSNYNLADVYGGAAIAPFDSITYSSQASPLTVPGFSDGAGGTRSADFSDVIDNASSASLEQVRAWMDAAMLQDDDIDQRVGGSFRPKRADELYTVVDGIVITRQGLYINNIPAADQQNIIFTDDTGVQQQEPQTGDVRITVPDAWINDTNGFFQAFTSASYNGADPVTFQNASGANVVGTSADVIGNEIRFTVSEADLDTTIVVTIEGNGGATFDIVSIFLDSNSPIIRASANPSAETFLAA